MDETRFDDLVKSVDRFATRRAAFKAAGAGGLAAVTGALGFDAEAKKKKKKKKNKCKGKIACGKGCCPKSQACLGKLCSLYRFVTRFGSEGTGPGQFVGTNSPGDLAIDGAGNVYALDTAALFGAVLKFDNDGDFLDAFDVSVQFLLPSRIAVAPNGDFFITGNPPDVVIKYDSDGGNPETFGDGFDGAAGVAVASNGDVFVTDFVANTVQRFDSAGALEKTWGSPGTGESQFDGPTDLALDSAGNVFVVDRGNDRVQKFDSDGTFLTEWGEFGAGDGQFDFISDIAVDADGNVYVGEFSLSGRIQKFDNDGAFITRFGNCDLLCEGQGMYFFMEGIAVDADGNVFVSESFDTKIEKLAPVGGSAERRTGGEDSGAADRPTRREPPDPRLKAEEKRRRRKDGR